MGPIWAQPGLGTAWQLIPRRVSVAGDSVTTAEGAGARKACPGCVWQVGHSRLDLARCVVTAVE
jgi:hypothetical protein